jgi:ferrous iron transport protein B
MSQAIALAGNPNSGKTTLFNELTGSRQHVGNWPGVTVDKKVGKYKKGNSEADIVDLPGIYSLSPYSAEEIVARNYIINEKPSAIINIVDATNIERNLYLSLQIIETGVPVVIALNMMDEVEARGDKIDIKKLEKDLGVRVVPITARAAKGINELMQVVLEVTKINKTPQKLNVFTPTVEKYIHKVEDVIGANNGWTAIKLIEGDEIATTTLSEDKLKKIQSIVEQADNDLNGDAEAAIADMRYKYITKVVKDGVVKKEKTGELTVSDKIDKIVTNRFLAIPIFLLIMYVMFEISFGKSIIGVGALVQGWVDVGINEMFIPWFAEVLAGIGASDWAVGLVCDGILSGIGAVFTFLPQIIVLFLLLSILEDSGYMARAAFVMDRIFKKFGLSGKSFIPMLMGFGCSVPALMSARTLDNEKDRRMTMFLIPFMSCGAKLPIYAIFVASIFADHQALVIYSIYLVGVAVAVLSGILLKSTLFKGETATFVMELPQYRFPTFRSMLIHVWDKVKAFAIKAGTVLLAATIIIWFTSNFSFGLQMVEDMDASILGTIGKFIAPLFTPLGFNDWKASVSILTGFVAKEAVVSTMGVLYAVGESEDALMPVLQSAFTPLAAYAFMVFNLLAAPCFAAISAMRHEMGSWKWTLKALGYQTLTAYVVAFLIYNIGHLFV